MAGVSATPAVHFSKQHKVPFTEHEYRYEERGGTAVSSRELGVDEHIVIKTLVMEDERKQPLIVLMHGDREVSTKNLARQIGAKTVTRARRTWRRSTPDTSLAARRRLAHASQCRYMSSDRSQILIAFISTGVPADSSCRWLPPI